MVERFPDKKEVQSSILCAPTNMITDNYTSFLDTIFSRLDDLGVDVSTLYLDHFGYQASSNEDYDVLKKEFLTIGTELSEEIVGGRRVGIFKLHTPLEYHGRTIPAGELIAPKEGQICPSALEHVALVIDTDFASFLSRYPNLEFDTSKMNQPTFPMITLRLGEYLQVKFHLEDVQDIVANKKKR